MPNILVTGAAGFIGFHVAQRFLDSGKAVIGLDNINNYYDTRLKYDRLARCGIEKPRIVEDSLLRSQLNSNYYFIKQDIVDRRALDRLFSEAQFDIVCHLAAQAGVRYSIDNPAAYAESNLIGFVNIIEACRVHKIRHLVYASSSSVYGLNDKLPFSVRDYTDHPISLYGATKKSNELIAHVYGYLYRVPSTGLRLFTAYGPWGRPDMAYFRFTKAILTGTPVEVYNNGAMKRDFTYIDDLVECIVRASENPPDASEPAAPARIYNVGSGIPISLIEFISELENALGRNANIRMMPMQAGDMISTWADNSEFLRDFSYIPKTPLRTGIKRFVEWYAEFGQNIRF